MRWYSPRDWISCDDMSGSHDHSHSEDKNNNTIDASTDDVANNNNTVDDITNNSNTTDHVTNDSNNTSGWDEDWAELDEQTSSTASGASVSHRVCNHYPHHCYLMCNHYSSSHLYCQAVCTCPSQLLPMVTMML